MKKIVLIFIFFVPFTVFGQCKVNFLIVDSCVDSTKVLTELALLDSIGSTVQRLDGKFNLTTGLEGYALITVIRGNKYKYLRWKFIVPDDKEWNNIIKIPKLLQMLANESVQSESRYFYCNELCSGSYIDYYDNEQVRIKGQFIDGMPIGELCTYHHSGKINYIAKYSSKGKFRKSKLYKYNEDGTLKDIVSYRNYVNFMIDLNPQQGGFYGFVGFNPDR